MTCLEVRNLSRLTSLGSRIGLADRWWRRLKGLIGSAPLQDGEGLLLVPCQAVHTVGLRMGLDVLFLDRAGRVVASYERLAPASRTKWHRNARSALELPEGTIRRTGTTPGDQLTWQPATGVPDSQDVRRST